jgi:hypothetical protein
MSLTMCLSKAIDARPTFTHLVDIPSRPEVSFSCLNIKSLLTKTSNNKSNSK